MLKKFIISVCTYRGTSVNEACSSVRSFFTRVEVPKVGRRNGDLGGHGNHDRATDKKSDEPETFQQQDYRFCILNNTWFPIQPNHPPTRVPKDGLHSI